MHFLILLDRNVTYTILVTSVTNIDEKEWYSSTLYAHGTAKVTHHLLLPY